MIQTLALEEKKPDVAVRTFSMCIACGSSEAKQYLTAPDRFYSRTAPYRLIRCSSCSLVWLDAPPNPQEMGGHYGSAYDAFIRGATEKDPDTHWHGALARLYQYKDHGMLLDLGCGAGSFLNFVQGPSWKLYGIEISADAASSARRRTGAEVFAGDILTAPFPSNRFDAITCFHVFEHLYAPSEVMAKVWNWLKPGGVFCLRVPNIDSAEAHVFRSYWYPLELPRHLYHFTPGALRRLGTSVGFDEAYLGTLKVPFIEYSMRYIWDDILRAVGMSRTPLAHSDTPSLAWRVFRKGLRLTVLPMVAGLLSTSSGGEIIEAVFRKPEHGVEN